MGRERDANSLGMHKYRLTTTHRSSGSERVVAAFDVAPFYHMCETSVISCLINRLISSSRQLLLFLLPLLLPGQRLARGHI